MDGDWMAIGWRLIAIDDCEAIMAMDADLRAI
jgi:hypothetical protein